MGDAFRKEAGNVLVVEIEPGPAAGSGETEAGRGVGLRECEGRRGCAKALRERGRLTC